jgi:GNAT superfamily N-acetyltransferase
LEQIITLERWTGPCPDDRLAEFAALLEVIFRDIPSDDLEGEELRFLPEAVRVQEQSRLADGKQRWALAALDRATGTLIGLTELFWHPNRPNMMQQDFTGVLPTYRKQGIGRWLKAAMIAWVLHTRPEVAIIRTFNANSNAPMLGINRALGFQPYLAQATWQVSTKAICQYLASTLASGER